MSGISRSSLAALLPIKVGSEHQLLAALTQLGAGELSPFARVPGTHFARWAFVPSLKGADGKPLQSEEAYLLMCAEFDATLEDWIALLCTRAGAPLDAVMGNCDGWPGCAAGESATAYLVAHNAPPGFTVAGYREVTVEEVRDALALRQALRELAVRAQAGALDPDQLRREWEEVTR